MSLTVEGKNIIKQSYRTSYSNLQRSQFNNEPARKKSPLQDGMTLVRAIFGLTHHDLIGSLTLRRPSGAYFHH
ncbi:unnamed protein product [Nezara viridula]|uniref:Uncharacterized protein n=1 Tax=Nezara viridula TaxID=85310 RepID=A0A9P0HR12_NEZVI|nr:unnamed protein product [Nezara viridula]